MKSKVTNFIFYGFTAVVSIMVWLWYQSVNDGVLKILLYPHQIAVEIFYNIPLIYSEGTGFSYNTFFTIGRQCMGINFILIMFAMNTCMFISCFKNVLQKTLWLAACFTGAIITGILLSCMRILGSVPFVAYEKFSIVHSGIGIVIYFSALIGSYIFINKVIRRNYYEENC